MWPFKARKPRGVRLVLDDGRSIRCAVVRDKENDDGPRKAWVAIPLDRSAQGRKVVKMQADVIPPFTIIRLGLFSIGRSGTG